MDDVDSPHPDLPSSAWLRDDHRFILYALVSLALVVGGHRTWQEYHRHAENAARRARILRLVESTRREKERGEHRPHVGAGDNAGGGSGGGSSSTGRAQEQPPPSSVGINKVRPPTHDADSGTEAEDARPATAALTPAAALEARSKRSKERRKRGRDVYKEVLKKERKRATSGPKLPLLPLQPSTYLHTESALGERSASGSSATHSGSSFSQNTSVAGSSRSSSRARSVSEYESTEDTPRPRAAEWTAAAHSTTMSSDTPQDGRSEYSSMSDSQSSLGISTRVSSRTSDDQTEREHMLATAPRKPPTPPPAQSGPSSSAASASSASASASTSASASVSTGAGSPPTSSPALSSNLDLIPDGRTGLSISISQPVPSMPLAGTQPPWLAPADRVSSASGSRPRTQTHPKTPSSGSAASLSVSVSDTSWDGGDGHSPGQGAHAYRDHRYPSKSPPPPRFRSHSRASAVASPLPGANALTLMASPTSTPPPNATLQAQVASYKGALEAARKREDGYRKELERFKQECDVLRYRWNDDADRRRRREAELQTQLQLVTGQLQALSVSSQMQMQSFLPHPHAHQPHGPQAQHGFPLPPLPFPYPPPPAFSGIPGIGSPNVGGAMPLPYPFLTPNLSLNLAHMSPRNGSGSAVGSPAREYGAAAAGGVYDPLDEDADSVSSELAEAILKRPESMRSPSSTTSSGSLSLAASGSGSGIGAGAGGGNGGNGGGSRNGSRSASVVGRATRDGFTFASLSELGNPQPRNREADGWVAYDPLEEHEASLPEGVREDENEDEDEGGGEGFGADADVGIVDEVPLGEDGGGLPVDVPADEDAGVPTEANELGDGSPSSDTPPDPDVTPRTWDADGDADAERQ
ncbi:hypothetical protein DFH11DRAFT_729288 [Phellopilus nigrolimitatus]|nr:hypothetical protein DFH11DRAFT_729288 [Phellopilus nigrolimitatus]